MKNEEKIWLEFAKTDFGVAMHLDQFYHPKPLEVICYHCQQATEKAIKAVIVALCGSEQNGFVPKKHDLSFLLESIESSIEIPAAFYDYADTLTPYGVMVRYPNELYIDEYQVREALEYTKEMLEWSIEVIESKRNEQLCDQLKVFKQLRK